jgi:TOBE domain
MKGWFILVITLVIGAMIGAALVTKGPAMLTSYMPRSIKGPGERIEGQVVRKQRDGDRLLVKVNTAKGPMLVAFTQKVADLDVLLDPGDTVSLITTGYATFVDDPIFEGVKRGEGASPPAPASSGTPPSPAR